ncbi:hypothetical protein [Paenibacillus qinlingensis]|uniref:hypothetical protein n=1 Tax=Paenibacillus qinlingensis TaxID=1837343 RepID=UPI00156628C0|nr:hypothetical protein [Paenibacillus qinlingensis]NQX60730.1 hypothetical protein [Paenibacillus qinlingensis]
MSTIYEALLEKWCNSLLKLQISEINMAGIYGGIMCPACSRIHGRSADAIYPLMHMAHKTGDRKYLEAAIHLQDWSDHFSAPDGSWVNEVENGWKGISVFGAISLGEAIRHHGDILDEDVLKKWKHRLQHATEFLYDYMTISTGNINYPISAALAFAISGEVLKNEKFNKRARDLGQDVLAYFTENKLIFGEGRPQDGRTPKGCRAVDLGYNVEESLPFLTMYGLMMNDEDMLNLITDSLRAHLDFMLPDGAWDNSWGSRNYKWTYWGSRTSDGCQAAYALLADRDPQFAEAALRNTQLLDSCTHDGMLYGGPHNYMKGELPCIHHTFCHAKALATVIDYQAHRNTSDGYARHIQLPRELAVGVKSYPEIATWLTSMGSWRSTITAYDWIYNEDGHASGGSVTMLWHDKLGPLLCGSMTKYQMYEGTNAQRDRERWSMPLTPRIELESGGETYSSTYDYCAKVSYTELEDEIVFLAVGTLRNSKQQIPRSGEMNYQMEYRHTRNVFVVNVRVEAGSRGE